MHGKKTLQHIHIELGTSKVERVNVITLKGFKLGCIIRRLCIILPVLSMDIFNHAFL